MKKQTKFMTIFVALIITATIFVAAKPTKKSTKSFNETICVVNFEDCVYKSKMGLEGQKSLKTIESEFNKAIAPTQKEWETIDKQLADTEYTSGIAPKKQQELENKKVSLQQALEMQSYQFNQMYSQARMQMLMVNRTLASQAAETVAKAQNKPFVVDSSAFLYYNKESDLTNKVIEEMNTIYDKEQKNKIKALPAPSDDKKEKTKSSSNQTEENTIILPSTNTTEPIPAPISQ